MYESIYFFFYNTIFMGQNAPILSDILVTINDVVIGLDEYLATICSLVSIIFIVVLCCLFVYKIIKLVGNLIR